MHCLQNQCFQHWQGKISGAKSSRRAMTQTYQFVTAWIQYVPENVQSCTAMYCHVLPCTAKSTYSYVFVRIRTYSYVFLVICLPLYQFVLVCTGMYCHAKIYQKYKPVHTPQEYKAVYTGTYPGAGPGTYRYQAGTYSHHTIVHQLYKIPDDGEVPHAASVLTWQTQ